MPQGRPHRCEEFRCSSHTRWLACRVGCDAMPVRCPLVAICSLRLRLGRIMTVTVCTTHTYRHARAKVVPRCFEDIYCVSATKLDGSFRNGQRVHTVSVGDAAAHLGVSNGADASPWRVAPSSSASSAASSAGPAQYEVGARGQQRLDASHTYVTISQSHPIRNPGRRVRTCPYVHGV